MTEYVLYHEPMFLAGSNVAGLGSLLVALQLTHLDEAYFFSEHILDVYAKGHPTLLVHNQELSEMCKYNSFETRFLGIATKM